VDPSTSQPEPQAVGQGTKHSQEHDLRDLVLEYYSDIYRYAYRLTGKPSDAEDLTQDTFLIAHRKIEQLRDLEKMKSWLFTILRSCFLRNRRKRVALTGLELAVDAIPDRAVQEVDFDQDRLQDAIDGLPAEFKVVLLMFYFEHISYKEIAERLEMPIGTVMSRLARAKGRLRQRLLASEPVKSSPERNTQLEAMTGADAQRYIEGQRQEQ
jgi:RNA polymerase sigma-70 factor (ECF subfamily)